MKKMLAVSIFLVMISLLFTGCSAQPTLEQPQQQQTVEIDTAKLDVAVDKLANATEQLEEVSKNYKEALENKSTDNMPIVRASLVLCVSPDGQEFSDRTQVINALSRGGMIVIKDFSEESIDKSFTTAVCAFGALDEAGYSFTKGDVLNYISSFGWEIEAVRDVGKNSDYYFSKELGDLQSQM